MAPTDGKYGIAGSTSKQSTSPTASAPAPTGVTNQWYQSFKRNQPSVSQGGGPAFITVPGNPVAGAAVADTIRNPSINRGTPMRPVAQPSPPRQLTYFGGTPTNTVAGYRGFDEYFGGTPTGNYDPNATPTSPSEIETIKNVEDERKKRQQEAADAAAAKAAEDARLREIFNTLGALTPEQQMAYRQSVRDAEREFEMMRNQIQLARRGARRDFRQGVRSVNRQQAGGAQDLATALAYLGMDTSPATLGVGLQDVEMQADIARSGLAASRAEALAAADAQLTQALIQRNRQRSAAEQARLNARAQASLRAQNFASRNPGVDFS